jgi:TPR repeat protein
MTAHRPAATALVVAACLAAALLAPAAAQTPAQAPSSAPPQLPAKPAAKPQKPATPRSAPASTAAPAAASAPTSPGREPDLVFGAFQRGFYLTALSLATRRVEEKGDIKAMTLLGEIYANGFGVARDDQKAAEWYKLAADRGDREAMFALAMFRLSGRGGPINREEAIKLLAGAAKLGHVAAAYDIWRASCCRRIMRGPPSSFAPPPRRAARKPNTRSPRSTRMATACRKIRYRPRACWPRRRSPTIPMPSSNTASRCSTAPV